MFFTDLKKFSNLILTIRSLLNPALFCFKEALTLKVIGLRNIEGSAFHFTLSHPLKIEV